MPPLIPGSGAVEELAVVVRQSVRMECEPTGDPKPKVSWYKDGKLLVPKKNRYMRMMHGGKVLQIMAARVKDTGTYKCKAENIAGEAEKRFTLAVHGRLLLALLIVMLDTFLRYRHLWVNTW